MRLSFFSYVYGLLVFLCVWIFRSCFLPLFLLGCLSFAYCVRSSLSLVDNPCISCNKCCKYCLPACHLCLKSVYGVPPSPRPPHRTFPSYVIKRVSFMVSQSLILLRKSFPAPSSDNLCHIFSLMFYRFLMFRFWPIWNLLLCMLWGKMPILLCLRFPYIHQLSYCYYYYYY